MFGIQNYASFVVAILIFQLVPGPGTIAILSATAKHGIRAGLAAVLGTVLGDILYMVAAVAGLAAVMQANPVIFNALQWFGAAYLCWLGVQLLRARFVEEQPRAETRQSTGLCFRQAFTVSLTNPKVVLFFVAFFPLFLRSDAAGTTLAAMMLHVTVLSLIYQVGLVLVGNWAARSLATIPSMRKWATRLAGVALIGFGVRLALNNR
jgi:threonine/homoserine/homoserine lactone efflux protein